MTIPEGHQKCSKCDDGWQTYIEEGNPVQDACYHCGNTGYVTDEQAYRDRIDDVAGIIANKIVQDMKDEPPDEYGGWQTAAAENGVSEYEYLQGHEYTHRNAAYKTLIALYEDPTQRQVLRTIVELIDPPEQEPLHKWVPLPKQLPAVGFDDEIPF